MKKFSPKEILMPTIVLLLICVISSALLGGTNMLTKDKIASIEAEIKAEAMQTVMADADSFGEPIQISDTLEYSEALDKNGNVIGYAFTATENGYGGEIKIMVGVNTDGTVKKIDVLSADNETPGLGLNIKKETFLDQFIGKTNGIAVNKNTPDENEIQALTSATISSSAVTRAVNASLDCFENQIKGGAENG